MKQSLAAANRTLGMEGDGESPDTSPAAKPRSVDSTIAIRNSDKSKLAAVLKLHPYVCVSYVSFQLLMGFPSFMSVLLYY